MLFRSGFAIDSWHIFKRLKAEGKIPAHVRYQVDIASIPSVLAAHVAEPLHDALEPAVEEAIIGQIAKICAEIPHDQLAIQYDVASSIFFHLETGKPTRFGANAAEMMKTFVPMHVRLGNAVPADVHLIYHFCYGEIGRAHV